MELKNKVAFVSGASRGIGRATVEALAREGANVAINFNSHKEEAQQLAKSIEGMGRRALLCQGDVTDYQSIENMIAETVQAFGQLDIAIFNAAYSARGPFYEIPLAEIHRTVDVTLWGAFNVLRVAARQMIRAGKGGSIVGVSSPHAFTPIAKSMAYNMAKAALDQMARTAANELAEHRIRVNLVHPGWTDTPGERKFFDEEQLRAAAEKTVWGRLATAEEIARGIVFMCNPASDYITGSSLLIDGGHTLAIGGRRS